MKGVKLISAEDVHREAKIKLGDMAAGIDPNEVAMSTIPY